MAAQQHVRRTGRGTEATALKPLKSRQPLLTLLSQKTPQQLLSDGGQKHGARHACTPQVWYLFSGGLDALTPCSDAM